MRIFGKAGMKIQKYIPAAPLKPFVKSFMILESERGMENMILPDTSIVLAFRLKGNTGYTAQNVQTGLPASVITGIRKSSRVIGYAKQTASLLVSFHETGAAAFFRNPLHELQDASISLHNFIKQQKIRDIEEQLAEASTNLQRVALIEQFLLSELKNSSPDLLVRDALQTIRLAKGQIRVKDLITPLYISRDPFEKRFRQATGTSPKQFAGIVRLRNLIDNYTGNTSLTDAAHTAGYFDQAHFIKDFKSFTGQAPLDFFRTFSWW